MPVKHRVEAVQDKFYHEWSARRDAFNAESQDQKEYEEELQRYELSLAQRGTCPNPPPEAPKKPPTVPSIFSTILSANLGLFLLCGLCELTYYVVSFAQPYLIRGITGTYLMP